MKRSGEMSGLFLLNKFGQSEKRVGGNRRIAVNGRIRVPFYSLQVMP